MTFQTGSIDADGLARTPDGKLYVTAVGTAAITGGSVVLDNGTVTTPTLSWLNGSLGFWSNTAGQLAYETSGTTRFVLGGSGVFLASGSGISWSTGDPTVSGGDTGMFRAGANTIVYNGATSPVTTTARTEIQKAVTAFTNAVAKATVTITIPNSAQSASVLYRVTGSLGAGGAIGANEASATNAYMITVTRTAGVNAVAAISAAFGAAAAAVAGAATVTATAAMSSVVGAVGATNTFTVDVTISRSGGSSDNHTAVVTASLLNANATGVTIS